MHVVSNQQFISWQGTIDNVLLLARAMSGAELDDAVQTVLERHLRVDHFSLFSLNPARPPAVLAAGGCDRDGVSPTLARAYAARFCRLDPVASSLQECPPTDQILVHSRRAADVRDAFYRRECYDKPGITQRLTIHSALSGTWRTLHLYRKHRSPDFTESDIENALRAAACILTMVPALSARRQRNDTKGRIAEFDERLHRLPGRLTERECQVCARALIGMSVEGTALDLNIAPTSVATYRKRAYQKLGITSQNEMFALLC